ncbi:MAG TPA: ABC transporter substrate-binding protein [Casimicrobiaceae bacterium]|nr:ABC transporter substrate-binding protein [Casimicrobiaceae bacterium]
MRRFTARSIFASSLAIAVLAWAASGAHAAADPNKVLHVAIEAGDDGFDPSRSTNYYSGLIEEVIFDRLLTYDYLAEPVKLVPMLAEAMPEVSDEGRTYTFHLRKGVYFTPDPAFRDPRRELVAADVVYSIKRFLDPKNRSPWRFLFAGKIVGLDEQEAQAKQSGEGFDYDAKIPGLEAVDRYTVRFRLTDTDYNFAYILASPTTSIVAREVIERYSEDTKAHPVGSGPYMLAKWERGARIVLHANPGFRGFVWDFQPSANPWDKDVVAAMKGKQMPQIGVVDVRLIEEEQSRWLAFLGAEIDYIDRFGSFSAIAIPNNKVAPNLAKRGIRLYRYLEPEMTYYYFNMVDPVVGSFDKDKIALRRAITMAYDIDEEIRVIRKSQAIRAESPIPPGVVGFDPNYRAPYHYDPVLANKLLDYFGYKRGSDGYRTLPDGKPLVVTLWSTPEAIAREYDELWKKSLDVIGVRFATEKIKFADQIKKGRACQMQFAGAAWTADWPTADNFLQLSYGPNVGEDNYACYKSAAFDEYYRKAQHLPDSPERNKLYLLMVRQMAVDSTWVMGATRYKNTLFYPWLQGYKKHPILHAPWPFMDIDNSRRPQ